MDDPLRLLLLEDSADDAELNTQALSRAGIVFTALRVDSQHAFVAALDAFRPDLILADYRLPGFDGLQALAIVRDRYPDIPYIFVSGVIGEEFAVDSIRQGATDYVLKDRLGRLPVAVQRAMAEAKLRAQRREAEVSLRKLERAVEFSPVSIVVTDRDGVIEYANPKCSEITGYANEEMVGQNPRLFRSGRTPIEVYRQLWDTILHGGEWCGEILNRKKDGDLFWERASISPVTDESGQITNFVAIKQDITDRMRAEAALRESENRYRSLVENAPVCIHEIDMTGRITSMNRAGLLMMDLKGEDEVRGFPYLDAVCPAERGNIAELLARAYAGETSQFEFVASTPDGLIFKSCFVPIKNGNGDVVRLMGITENITERKRAEAELRIAAIAFESQEGMFITDAWSVILRVNRAFTDITGYTPEEAVGRKTSMLKSGRHDAAFYAAMWERIHRDGSWQGEIWNRRKNGEVYPEWLTVTAVNGAGGEVTHYVATLTDITLRKAAEDEIKHLAFYDPLTRLPNRRLLLDRLQQALASSTRSRRKGALLFIDLDNFKTLNDTLGHDIGDLLLQQVAQRLATCVREGDTVARLGGDEFVVMLEDLSGNPQEAATQTETVGEKILSTLNQPYELSGHQHHSTPSIGVTLFGDQKETVEDLLRRADLAMYQAKAAGRNTLRFFDPEMQAAVTVRAALEVDLRQGLQQNKFLLYYQAQVNEVGRMTGAEALLRWQHPRRGLMAPADFIPLAEETGLILPLGHWVLETACAQLAAWAARPEMAHLTLAVNVSARQFHHPDFVDQVLAVLDQTGADPQKLKLELTESLLLDDVEDIIAKMTALKAKGVGFSLDDFGTGYSSLSYLKRLPLDQLKIDQSFVRDILTDSNDAAIARTIVALAQSMGLGVIAEGVETEAQRDFLARQSCHAFQGYLFGRPLPVEQFESH